MSAKQLIINAVARLPRDRDITAAEIVIAAWRENPTIFCLEGFQEYPNSNKILAELMGKGGLVASGLLEKTGKKRYRLTNTGRKSAEKCSSPPAPALPPPPLDPSTDKLPTILQRLLATKACLAMQNGKRDELDPDDLLDLLGICHPAPDKDFERAVADTLTAIDSLDAKLNDSEHGTAKLNFVRNTIIFLVDKYQGRLQTTSNANHERNRHG